MKEIEIDLHNCIEFEEKWEFIVCCGSYKLWDTEISCCYNYHNSKDNKLRRIYTKNKVFKKLCEMAETILYPYLNENEWQH